MNIQFASFNEVEIEVCDILLNLKDLIQESESRPRVRVSQFTRSSKRRRSDKNLGLNYDVNSSPNSVQRNNSQAEDNDNNIDPTSIILKPNISSPDAPLSLSPNTEFDDKPIQYSSKKSSNRKTREELMHTIEKLTRCRELLRGEVENVRSYYNSQKAYYLKLKAIKERVMTMLKDHGPQTCLKFQYPMGHLPQAQPMYSYTNVLGTMNHTGPQGPILNINVNLVDWAFFERKAQYAEARRKRRMKIVETKKIHGFNKTDKGKYK